MLSFAASDFMTLTNVEVEETALRTRETRTYMMGDKRKAVVRLEHLHGTHIDRKRVIVDAYVSDPHEYVWYNCDGEAVVEQREWGCVFHDMYDGHDYDKALAIAYGILACARW